MRMPGASATTTDDGENTPVRGTPIDFCQSRTACLVSDPYLPVGLASRKPRAARLLWSWRTSLPSDEPTESSRQNGREPRNSTTGAPSAS